MRKEVTSRSGKTYLASTGRNAVAPIHTRFAQRRLPIYGRESEEVPAVRRQGSHAAPVHAIGPDCRRARVPGLSVHGICGSQSSRDVGRHAPEGKGGRPLMRELIGALTAFLDEHQRCGELDGGRDNGHVWLACFCGARIVHPVSEPPPAPARR